MPISTIDQKGLNAPLTLTSPVLTTPNLGTPSALVLTNATALPKAALPTGSVLQVVSANTTSSTSVNSFTPTDVTGLSLSITPSSSSNRILLIVSVPVSATSIAWFNLVRNGTNIGMGTGGTYNSTFISSCIAQPSYMMTPAFNFLDSPATTSAITYKIQMYSDATAVVNKRASDNVFATSATITAMEIAA